MPRSLSGCRDVETSQADHQNCDVMDIHHFNMMEMVWLGKATPVEFNMEQLQAVENLKDQHGS